MKAADLSELAERLHVRILTIRTPWKPAPAVIRVAPTVTGRYAPVDLDMLDVEQLAASTMRFVCEDIVETMGTTAPPPPLDRSPLVICRWLQLHAEIIAPILDVGEIQDLRALDHRLARHHGEMTDEDAQAIRVASLRATMGMAPDHTASLKEVVGLVAAAGYSVGKSTVRWWAATGEITKLVGEDGRVSYRLSEVLDKARSRKVASHAEVSAAA